MFVGNVIYSNKLWFVGNVFDTRLNILLYSIEHFVVTKVLFNFLFVVMVNFSSVQQKKAFYFVFTAKSLHLKQQQQYIFHLVKVILRFNGDVLLFYLLAKINTLIKKVVRAIFFVQEGTNIVKNCLEILLCIILVYTFKK